MRPGETMKHWTLAACAVLSALSLSACIAGSPQSLPAAEFTTQGEALAIQLSKSAIRYEGTPSKTGYMVLADPSGRTRAFQSGQMFGAQPLWTESGLFYGGAASELLTTDEGTREIARDIEPVGEMARYPHDGGRGFMSVYNIGADPGGYQQPVLIGHPEGTESLDVRGVYMNMGACSDTLYAVTETKFAPNLLEQAKAVHRENTGDSSQDEEFDVLVQVFPSDDPQNPTVLEAIPHDERFSRGNREFLCYGETISLLSFLLDHPDAQRGDGRDPSAGHAVLESWNLRTHERRSLDLTDDDGAFLDLTRDDLTIPTGTLDGSTFRFVTMTGKVFSVDIDTGIGTHLYTFAPSPEGGSVPRYDATTRAIYRLDNGKNDDSVLDFSRYVFDTERFEHLFDVESLAPYRRGGLNIEGIAVNPVWEKALS